MATSRGSSWDTHLELVQDRAGATVGRRLTATERRMLDFVDTFPTLRGVLQQWDPAALDAWAEGPAATEGGIQAAQFVLSVWNPANHWRCGEFCVVLAMGVWDGAHRAAFLEWAKKPWWP